MAPRDLRSFLRERLPDAMVPAAYVLLDQMPLTPNRKVDRKALPAPQRHDGEEDGLAPRTPVEEILAGIWADLLGVSGIGANSHFFELGGHSLLATRVVSRLRAAFGVEIPLRSLFEAPILADLAARIETARGEEAGLRTPPLVPLDAGRRAGPLSPMHSSASGLSINSSREARSTTSPRLCGSPAACGRRSWPRA
jgi:acyl carrier protein